MSMATMLWWLVLLAIVSVLSGCGASDDDGAHPTATPTIELGGPRPTATPLVAVGLRVSLTNIASSAQRATLSGTRLSGPSDGRATTYGPLVETVSAQGGAVVAVPDLAPGVWLHRIAVEGTGQQQYRQGLVIDDPGAPATLSWTLFAVVLSINHAADDGAGTCGETCTLRDAVATANKSTDPTLIVFDHVTLGTPAHVQSVDRRILIQSPGLTIDGTDEHGDPSPLVDFSARTFPSRITLRGTRTATPTGPSPCPCSEDYGGTLFASAPGVEFIGLHIDRVYPPQKEICCGDQTLIEMGNGSRNTRVDTCLLDGGGRAITNAITPMGRTGQATSKDCIKPEHTGATPDHPVVVTNSELSYCLDRGVKVQDGYLELTNNWIHNNLRCALFAIVPGGAINAVGNLIEENAMNCPRGAPPDCVDQVVTRPDGPQVSAQGTGTTFSLDGNVVRNGPLNGVYWQVGSTGTLTNSFVCGMANAGVISERQTGTPSGATVRGTASVLNLGSGVEVRSQVAIDLGSDPDAGAGHNAFAGNPVQAGVYNNLTTPATILAQGNQWQSCYPSSGGNADTCDVDAVAAADTNDASGSFSEVDVRNPEPHQGNGAVTLTAASPSHVVEGALVALTGSGFDAVSGIAGLTPDDCAALASTNTCSPLRGTCVEFMVGGVWTEATDVLAVTPTFVMVRAPFTCVEPTTARVRRAVRGGGEAVSDPLTICTN